MEASSSQPSSGSTLRPSPRLRQRSLRWWAYAGTVLLSAGFFYMTQPDWRMARAPSRNLLSGQILSDQGQALPRTTVQVLADVDKNGRLSAPDIPLGSVRSTEKGAFSLLVDHGRTLEVPATVHPIDPEITPKIGASLCFKTVSIPPGATVRRVYIRFFGHRNFSQGTECMISRMSSNAAGEKLRKGSLLWHLPEVVRERVYDSPDLERLLRSADSSPEFWVEGITDLPFFDEEESMRPVLIVEYTLPNHPYLLLVGDAEVGPTLQGSALSLSFGPHEHIKLVCSRRPAGQVSGQVFEDSNGDGVAQAFESGWREAELALYHHADGFVAPVARFRTGASGRFQWETDRAGTYLLCLRAQSTDRDVEITTQPGAFIEVASSTTTLLPQVQFGLHAAP